MARLYLCVQPCCTGTHLFYLRPLCEQVKLLLCALNKKPKLHILVGVRCVNTICTKDARSVTLSHSVCETDKFKRFIFD